MDRRATTPPHLPHPCAIRRNPLFPLGVGIIKGWTEFSYDLQMNPSPPGRCWGAGGGEGWGGGSAVHGPSIFPPIKVAN